MESHDKMELTVTATIESDGTTAKKKIAQEEDPDEIRFIEEPKYTDSF
jgi:hypothetical protein